MIKNQNNMFDARHDRQIPLPFHKLSHFLKLHSSLECGVLYGRSFRHL